MFPRVGKHQETLVRDIGKHQMFLNLVGSKFCFRNNVSTGGRTGKHLRKHRESQMFPQHQKVVGSIPTVAGHIFQARPVWIYTQE
jgi:hypothetical protein